MSSPKKKTKTLEKAVLEDESCPQCGVNVNEKRTRMVQDICGHRKCRLCLIREENGCGSCSGRSGENSHLSNSEPPNGMLDHLDRKTKPETVPVAVIVHMNHGEMNKSDSTFPDLTNNTLPSPSSASKDPPLSLASVASSSPVAVKTTKRRNREKIESIWENITVLIGNPLHYQCNLCMKKFKTRSHVKYHEVCQTGEKPFRCEQCGKGCISKSHFAYHMRTHTGERPYTCPECGKSFTQRTKVNRHMKSHTGERPYICEICGKRFANSHSLRSHNLIHTGERPFECQECGKKFTEQTNLRKHRIIHTGERPWMCEDCGKSFSQRYTLELHKRTHTGEKPYRCKTCGKTFSCNKDITRHSLIHTGTKPYMCTFCVTSFRRKDNLERHIRNTHNGNRPDMKYYTDQSCALQLPVSNSPPVIVRKYPNHMKDNKEESSSRSEDQGDFCVVQILEDPNAANDIAAKPSQVLDQQIDPRIVPDHVTSISGTVQTIQNGMNSVPSTSLGTVTRNMKDVEQSARGCNPEIIRNLHHNVLTVQNDIMSISDFTEAHLKHTDMNGSLTDIPENISAVDIRDMRNNVHSRNSSGVLKNMLQSRTLADTCEVRKMVPERLKTTACVGEMKNSQEQNYLSSQKGRMVPDQPQDLLVRDPDNGFGYPITVTF